MSDGGRGVTSGGYHSIHNKIWQRRVPTNMKRIRNKRETNRLNHKKYGL
jgi:hypothetical protein